jgi:hypothetical protein
MMNDLLPHATPARFTLSGLAIAAVWFTLCLAVLG